MQEVSTVVERVGGACRFRVVHAEDPRHPGLTLCGTRLNGKPSSASAERCVVCEDLARRSFCGR